MLTFLPLQFFEKIVAFLQLRKKKKNVLSTYFPLGGKNKIINSLNSNDVR